MNNNTQKAKSLLTDSFTVILCLGDSVVSSSERGIKPLISFIEEKKDLRGYSAADKIVGKAAAMLYVLLGVKEVFAPIMSRSAVEVLSHYGITPFYDSLVEQIINRTKTGICPMEQTVSNINHPSEAFPALKSKILELKSK